MQSGSISVNGQTRVAHVERAVTLWQRLQGLLGRAALAPGRGLLLERCGAIHTVGMRFAIDVIFLDRAWRVCRVRRAARPGLPMVSGGWRAARALEVAAGWLPPEAFTPGAAVTWRAATTQESENREQKP
jgi:uncharacterized membrane protein (UPF0127 family)